MNNQIHIPIPIPIHIPTLNNIHLNIIFPNTHHNLKNIHMMGIRTYQFNNNDDQVDSINRNKLTHYHYIHHLPINNIHKNISHLIKVINRIDTKNSIIMRFHITNNHYLQDPLGYNNQNGCHLHMSNNNSMNNLREFQKQLISKI